VIAYFNNPNNLTSLATIGTKIIEGLVKGIVDGYSLVKNAIIAAVNKASAEFKNAFGIKSPSLVMNVKLGKPLAQGIAQGIRDNAGLISSAMRDALGAKSMMASPMVASRAASSNYNYSTRNFNQNLGGVSINNGMDLAQFTGVMRTLIRQEVRR
jgi:phage-related protein